MSRPKIISTLLALLCLAPALWAGDSDSKAERHRQVALERAQNFYRFELQVGSGAVRVTAVSFELEDPEIVTGWTERYSTQGKVFLEYFDSRGRSFNRTTDHFEVVTEQKPSGSIKAIDFSRK